MDTLSYRTVSVSHINAAQSKKWIIIDAEGQTLGRMCANAAKIIRGKHKPSFTPHVDGGDYVIVINSDKVVLTGQKMDDKVYVRHTGYPGGQRFATPREWLSKDSTKIIQHAIRGMLPKNRLGRRLFGNLHVYTGAEHPHAAQQPVAVDILEPSTWLLK